MNTSNRVMKSQTLQRLKRLIRKEDNDSGVRSVETVKEDRSSAKGNTAQAIKKKKVCHVYNY